MDGAGARAFRSPALARLLAAAACLLYAGLFVAAASHSQWLVYPLIPDEVVLSTFGGAQLEFALLDRLPAATLAAAAAVTIQGIGFAGLSALRLQPETRRGERIGLGFAIGLSSLSTWTLAIGTLIGLDPEWPVLAPPAIVAAVGWWLEIKHWRATNRRSDDDRDVKPGRDGVAEHGHDRVAEYDRQRRTWWRFAWLPFALLLLLGAVLPPWEFDVLEYHLQVPKEWHQAGRIRLLPHNVYGNMPLGAEMAALWSMTLAAGPDAWFHGALAGKALIGLFTISVAWTLWTVAARESGPRIGALAATLFLSTPWILHTAMAGLVDSVLAGFTLCAYVAWHRARSASAADAPGTLGTPGMLGRTWWSPALAWLALAGGMAGAAAAVKYTGVVFALLPLAVCTLAEPLLFAKSRRRSFQMIALRFAVFLAAAGVSGGGWYLKNAVLTGNPVYPLLAGVAGPGLETVEQQRRWSAAHRPGGAADTADRSVYGVKELLAAGAQIGWRSPWQSPLLPPLVLFALIFMKPRRELLPWLAPPLWILAVWWLATHRIDRFWIPTLPFAALLASQGVVALDVVFGRRWVDGGLAVVFAWLLLIAASPGSPAEPFANNRFFVSLARSREAQTHPAHRWLNAHVPATGKVLLVGDARPFYVRPPAIYNTCFDRDALSSLIADRPPADWPAAFRAAGITHVFVDWSELARYRSPGNYGHTSIVTPALIHGELVERLRLLRPIVAPGGATVALGAGGKADSGNTDVGVGDAGVGDVGVGDVGVGDASDGRGAESLLAAVQKAGGELFEVVGAE